MLRQERKTLRLIKKKFGFDRIIFLDSGNSQFVSDEIQVTYRYKNMPHIINALANAGFLTLSNHPTFIYFSLTYEGYYRSQLLMNGFISSFFQKWIPGFISGVAVAFVAEWLIHIFL